MCLRVLFCVVMLFDVVLPVFVSFAFVCFFCVVFVCWFVCVCLVRLLISACFFVGVGVFVFFLSV